MVNQEAYRWGVIVEACVVKGTALTLLINSLVKKCQQSAWRQHDTWWQKHYSKENSSIKSKFLYTISSFPTLKCPLPITPPPSTPNVLKTCTAIIKKFQRNFHHHSRQHLTLKFLHQFLSRFWAFPFPWCCFTKILRIATHHVPDKNIKSMTQS